MSRLVLTALTAFILLATLSSPALAQDRATSGRSRLELSFDHGYGFGTEGQFVELASDLRLYSPEGIGGVFRAGGALQGLSNAMVFEIGVAARVDLVSSEHFGLQLAGALGPSLASGPFDAGEVIAYGGFAVVHLDLWYRNFFVGLGVSGHALVSERHEQPGDPLALIEPGRADPILTLTPIVRIGGDWGL